MLSVYEITKKNYNQKLLQWIISEETKNCSKNNKCVKCTRTGARMKNSLQALFLNVGYCSIASCCHYSISSCFDIIHSRFAEVDKKPYEIDGNQLDFVMIGLTRRFDFQFL